MATGVNTVETVIGTLVEIRPGRRISLAVAEGSSGTTVFLCHGSGGNKDQWRNQWTALVKAGVRVVAWDNVGHGASPQPAERSLYRGDEFVADLAALVDRYGQGRIVLAGHSYGTRQSLALLADYAKRGELSRISAAVLYAPPPPGGPLGVGPIAWLPPLILEWLRPQLSWRFREMAWHGDTDPALIHYEESLTKRNSLYMIQALLTQAVQVSDEDLALIDLPVTVLAGDRDQLTPPMFAENLAAKLPRATIDVVQRSGHQIMLEQPALATAPLLAAIAAA
jgi:pimeloyl-ACP methyl ester carboxylesterase